MFIVLLNGIYCFPTSMTIVKTSHGAVRMAEDIATARPSPLPDQKPQKDPHLSSRGSCRVSGRSWSPRRRKPMMMMNQCMSVTMTASLRLHDNDKQISAA